MLLRFRFTGLSVLCFVGCAAEPAVDATATEETADTDDAESESESGTETGTEPGTETGTETDDGEAEAPECGNGIIEADEECDDGNLIADDGCTDACALPRCGDGLVQYGEGCDDGNDLDDDECGNDCVLASCGNGLVDPGEECEDGDDDDTDGCTNACLFPTCGDAIVHAGLEACDDGNLDDTDACTSACELAACGDGFVQPGEECEDGNEQSNDGCAACMNQRVLTVGGGWGYTCALLDTHEVRCWGYGYDGQLGYGNQETIGDNEYPYEAGSVELGFTPVSLTTGGAHSCVLSQAGALRCWGANWIGQLGYGNTDPVGDDEHPASVGEVNVGGPVVEMAAGDMHTCVVLETGQVRCWGLGLLGALGYGNTDDIGDDEEPAEVGGVNVGGNVVQLSVVDRHTCALLDTGAVRCWGNGEDGKLGYGNTDTIGDDEDPASMGDVDVGGTVVRVATGRDHTCALLEGGAVRCWGKGAGGRLGYGNANTIGDDEAPSLAGDVSVGGVVTDLAVGGDHTCVLLETGNVRCWGVGSTGALGYANTNDVGDDEVPATVGDVVVGAPVQSVAVGTRHTCALLSAGGVLCWGTGIYGALGYSNSDMIGDNEHPASSGNVQIF